MLHDLKLKNLESGRIKIELITTFDKHSVVSQAETLLFLHKIIRSFANL